jgi:inward rectifier potassium channel
MAHRRPKKSWDPLRQTVRIGIEPRFFAEAYQTLLTAGWWMLVGSVVVGFLLANLIFALAYEATGGGIENATKLSDFFFFSVQTMSTIGYGKMVPLTVSANILATFECLLGLVGFAMIAGLMFAKFARPTAGVAFSKNVLINFFEGKSALMLRMANEGGSQIVEAQLRLILLRREITAEGEEVRRLHDLQLMRSSNAFFALTWLAIHPIGPESPLYGATPESLRKGEVQIIASLVGLEEISAQTVQARQGYGLDDILFDTRFADVLSALPDGRRLVDYSKLSDVKPARHPTVFPLGSPPQLAEVKSGT